ncbi:MAG: transcriptional regulator, partial [Caldilineaceae bacterium]|nr:transcriptional regulator [Caldilineaceae bacterium]
MITTADEAIPTVMGGLVLSAQIRNFVPGAYLEFLRIDGTAWSDPIVDNLLIEGLLKDVVLRLDDKLVAHNRVAVDITAGSVEQRTSTYPLFALQQLTRNAIMHRTDEATNAP